ncbi:phosphotransferase family protein [Exiguobacterium flavidum]|uniref:phosphotransferase family protein n=1 Tax=Exiguobacterium flavidum TaxID=2184695 RepID=UPI001E5665D4|nr:aminoglycoside phosphotransferase family protein [Exiguobacterium flavidum]
MRIEHILNRLGTQSYLQLTGATSSTVIEAAGDVFRFLTNERWLKEEPDLIRHEAWALQLGFPFAPKLLAFEEANTEELPWLRMTKMEGRVDLAPRDKGEWVSELARVLALIHGQPLSSSAYHYRPYHAERIVPSWVRGGAWEWAARQSCPPSAKLALIHRDFHPVNVLFEEGRVTGVVDWINACTGPVEADLAHCRLNLALLESVDIADQFLRHYVERTGLKYDHRWDLMAVFDFELEQLDVYPGWEAHGRTDLSKANVRKQLENYVLKVYENSVSGF